MAIPGFAACESPSYSPTQPFHHDREQTEWEGTRRFSALFTVTVRLFRLIIARSTDKVWQELSTMYTSSVSRASNIHQTPLTVIFSPVPYQCGVDIETPGNFVH